MEQEKPQLIEGFFDASLMKTAIVASRFNEFLVNRLVEGAFDALRRHGAKVSEQTLIWVPGAFEIPLVAKKLASTGKFDAVICLGAVIKGDTFHFEQVSNAANNGIAQASLSTGTPMTNGILALQTLEQGIERSGSKVGNQGFNAALAAIELVNVLRRIG